MAVRCGWSVGILIQYANSEPSGLWSLSSHVALGCSEVLGTVVLSQGRKPGDISICNGLFLCKTSLCLY